MGRSVAVLSVIVVVLAAALAYSYVTLENQISSLKLSGHGACLFANSEFSKTGTTLTNITLTLEQQILSDKSIIDTLNSTQPAGYLGMIATLNDEITRDANMTRLKLGSHAPIFTDAAGRFQLTGLPAQVKVWLQTWKDGYVQQCAAPQVTLAVMFPSLESSLCASTATVCSPLGFQGATKMKPTPLPA